MARLAYLISPFVLRTMLVGVATASLVACGSGPFSKKKGQGGSKSDGDHRSISANCLTLTDTDEAALALQGYDPGMNQGYDSQYPGQPQSYDPGTGGVPIPPNGGYKGSEPPPPPPSASQPPASTPPPSSAPCKPINNGNGSQPPAQPKTPNQGGAMPPAAPTSPGGGVTAGFPAAQAVDATKCGKGGFYCDDGAAGQWPAQTYTGMAYNRAEFAACVDGFRRAGFNSRGMWALGTAQSGRLNSFFSNDSVNDYGFLPSIVMVDAANANAGTKFQLLNKNALYCIKGNGGAVGAGVVSSCHARNVLYGAANGFSPVMTSVVDCR